MKFRTAVVGCALGSLLFLVWLALRIGGAHVTDAVDDIGELLAALVAGVACVAAARHRRTGLSSWALLAASCFSWAAGEAIWSYYDLGRGVTVPFPSLADVGFLGSVPLAVAGLLTFAGVPRRNMFQVRGLLDSVLVAGSAFFVSWSFVFKHLSTTDGEVLGRVVSLAYPIGDVVLISLVLLIATRPGTRTRATLGLVMAGMAAFALADSSFAVLNASDSFGIGTVLDTGWVVGYLLVALGALRARWSPLQADQIASTTTRWTVLGPQLPLSVAGATFVWRQVTHDPLGQVSQCVAFALVVVLATRQVLVMLDNLKLTSRLEARVEERTAELRHQALHDALTGLANRTLFNEFLAGAVRRRTRTGAAVSVLFADLDNFKQVNDLHGHDVGDLVLKELARRFGRTLRGADVLARFGGDEFAVLVEGDPAATGPAELAGRLLSSLERPMRMGSVRIPLQVSIGMATDLGHCESAEELLRNADLAMYAAKAKGQHSFELYAPEMHSAILERMRTLNELRGALANEELVLHYQPVVDLASGEIRAVEALVRWNHPVRGLLNPDQFIPTAETTDLIVQLGNWVIETACRELRTIGTEVGAEGLGLNVNLSARQLADGHLVDVVVSALAVAGFNPNRLTLEVTESSLIEDADQAVLVLEELRQLGVKVAIDDFGTGYSSLNMLGKMPVDTLKIDRSFVTGIGHTAASAGLARRILDLAGDFHLHTVAEGVEARQQVEVLAGLGCEAIQGFVYYRPLPLESLKAALTQPSMVRPPERLQARRGGEAAG